MTLLVSHNTNNMASYQKIVQLAHVA